MSERSESVVAPEILLAEVEWRLARIGGSLDSVASRGGVLVGSAAIVASLQELFTPDWAAVATGFSLAAALAGIVAMAYPSRAFNATIAELPEKLKTLTAEAAQNLLATDKISRYAPIKRSLKIRYGFLTVGSAFLALSILTAFIGILIR